MASPPPTRCLSHLSLIHPPQEGNVTPPSPFHCCLLHPRACTPPRPQSYLWDHLTAVMEGVSQSCETLDMEGSGGQPVRARQKGVPCSPLPWPLSPALPASSWVSRPENPRRPRELCVRVSCLGRQGFLSLGAALGVHPLRVTCQCTVLTAPGRDWPPVCRNLVAFCTEAFVNLETATSSHPCTEQGFPASIPETDREMISS